MNFLNQGTAMLKKYNQSTQGLISGLLLNRTFTPSAGGTPLRTSLVRHNVETTYVVPGDWPKADGDAWFHDGMAPVAGSDVEYLIDGQQTFDAMLEAMETATKQGHYIFLLGWSIDVNFTMAGGKSFLQIVEERAQLGVAVRVLLWENNMPGIGEAERTLNALRTTKALDVTCYLDDNTKSPIPGYIPGLANVTVTFAGTKIPPIAETLAAMAGHPGVHSLGSHHHKILIVYGDEGLIGFCGGVDLDKNRLGYLHDVHLRVLGGSAKELLKIAEQRWEYARNDGVSPTPATIAGLSPADITVSRTSPYLARVMQTVGNPDIKGVPNTIWMAVDHAIKHAARHIYVEDQYFWSLDLVDALVEASKRVKSITIVLCGATVGEEDGLGMRHRALQRLVELGKPGIQERIGIFERKPGACVWVHAKLFIFDDEYAIVGTANASNRGYFHDSEATVGTAERGWDKTDGLRGGKWSTIEANFARRLRIKLWEEHLRLPPEELFDGAGACAHWSGTLPSNAAVDVYHAVDLRGRRRSMTTYQEEMAEQKTGGSHSSPPTMGMWSRARWWEAPYAEWAYLGSAGSPTILDPKGDE